MKKYIDADALCELARSHVGRTVDCNDIMRFPAADVAEVVRCKDCRYADGVYVLDSEPRYILCSKHRICVKPRGYCSYGERKIDGEKEGAENA